MRESVIQRIEERKIIAIVRGIPDKEQVLRVADAMYAGGIEFIEVTFNQSAPERFSDTTDAIAAINEHFGGKVYAGAGTVLTPEQAQLAADAGAQYIISPDMNVDVIQKTREMGLVSIPGVMTPTEITQAMRAGADFCKLFPAGILGSGYIKAIKAPLSHAKILATGGVDVHNIKEFQNAGAHGFGISGPLVNKAWIEAGEFHKITEVAKALCNAI
ncbi:MAG: bifunctional 4-hydroxy-2-oxoglutarate aldolase/2-dehydro-3-deoxy-phosphogluconate aldolase [Oscillospiraceae bacterium]|nr:bifunctional 4-hydroxy-2-oxoglutarate aldolase/2-dehydro-3-deoxy-phosphogluconate aldolase [Oscillospiraceae bacterium]